MNGLSPARSMRGMIFVALSAIVFGTIGVTTKALFTVADTNAYTITLTRAFIAASIVFLVGLVVLGRKLFRYGRQGLRLMIVAGALLAAYQVAFVLAVQRINVTTATLVTLCITPICVSLLSPVLLGEHLHPNVWIALCCAVTGVALLVGFAPSGATGAELWLGIGLSLFTAVASAFFQIISRSLANQYHPLQSLFIYFLVAGLLLAPITLVNGLVVDYPPVGWLLLLYLGVGISVLAYGFLMIGLRTTPAAIAATIALLEPLTGTILAMLLFGETLGVLGIVGAALLLTAMAIVFRANFATAQPVPE